MESEYFCSINKNVEWAYIFLKNKTLVQMCLSTGTTKYMNTCSSIKTNTGNNKSNKYFINILKPITNSG